MTKPSISTADSTVTFDRATLLALGLTDDDVRRRLRNTAYERIRPGAYALGGTYTRLWPIDRHRLLIGATVRDTAENVAVSHQSAAVLHGLPAWGAQLETVHLTRPGAGGGHRRRWIHTHKADLRPDEIVSIDGIPVTSIPRTLIDVARSIGFEAGVVAMDAALHAGTTSRDELADTCRAMRNKFGMTKARSAVAFADGRAESVGESRSRVAMKRVRLPAPRLQVDLWSRDELHLGRVDFYFDDLRTVGEFDGRSKYGRLLDTDVNGRSRTADSRDVDRAIARTRQALIDEKIREDAIRAIPVSVARWGWRHIADGTMLRMLDDGFRVGRRLRATPVLGRIG